MLFKTRLFLVALLVGAVLVQINLASISSVDPAPEMAMQSDCCPSDCPDMPVLRGDLNGIVKARTLAVATIRNIRQNLFWAFAYNTLGVPLAAGVLYPVFGLLMSPMFAAAAMSLSSVSVIANALRLRRLRL